MPLTLSLSFATGAVDMPDGGRKRHRRPTARLGGVGIFAVFFIGTLLWLWLGTRQSPIDGRAAALLSGGSLLLAAGVIDDVSGLSAPKKLCLQTISCAAALLFVPMPAQWHLFGISLTLAPPVAYGLYLVFTLLAVNAVNMIDGVDGLASGVSGTVLVCLALMCFGIGDSVGGTLCLLLLMPVAAFFLYNRPPATVFLGDGGAQFLGLAAAVLLLPAEGDTFALGSTAVLLLPLTELFVSVMRRMAKRKNPFRADDGHLHYRLLRRGMSPAALTAAYALLTCTAAYLGARL